MKVYNQDKTQILENYDLTKGYFTISKLNGELVKLYVPYSQKTLILREIAELKKKLDEWDYKTSKYVDGDYTEEEWAEIKAQRKVWRDRINELEGGLL
jgi:FtsZ-binding cell division protein ZapB